MYVLALVCIRVCLLSLACDKAENSICTSDTFFSLSLAFVYLIKRKKTNRKRNKKPGNIIWKNGDEFIWCSTKRNSCCFFMTTNGCSRKSAFCKYIREMRIFASKRSKRKISSFGCLLKFEYIFMVLLHSFSLHCLVILSALFFH